MPRTLTLIFCVLFATAAQATCPIPADAHQKTAHIEHVIDGDTVKLRDQRTVRMVGINTPEVDNPYREAEAGGEAASRWLKQRLHRNSKVTLVYFGKILEKDRYQRTLAHLYAGGENLQASMLKQGLAAGFNLDDDSLRPCYGRKERTARQKKQGLWRYPEHHPLSVEQAQGAGEGFRLVTGRVTGIQTSRRNQWLMLEGGIGVYIRHSDSQRLGPDFPPSEARRAGQHIVARGYLHYSHERWMMRIKHPNDLWLGDTLP